MGDKPKAGKDSKKMAKAAASHESDSDDSVGKIECDACGLSFNDGDAYEKHMQGKRHQKKVTEAKLMAKQLAAEKKKSDDDDSEDDDSKYMHCDVCDKDFSGYISYVAHIKGSVHAKNVKKQKLKEKLGNAPGVLSKDDGKSDADSDDDCILPKVFAACTVCGKDFSGPEAYHMHLKSAAHKKKVKQDRAVQNLKAKYEDESKNSDGEEFFSKCDVCSTAFSGVVPFKIHMESKVHKKNLEKKKVAEEMKEFYTEDSVYVCKECKKSFTDPLAFKYHVEKNNSHEKLKVKNALREFLNAHPEIVIVYPFDDDASGNESDNDGGDSSYYLICKLCNVSFTGPESAQDHVKSKKHLSTKKEIKIMKLLKDQKKNSQVKPTDESKDSQRSDKSSVKETSANGQPKNPEDSHDFELI